MPVLRGKRKHIAHICMFGTVQKPLRIVFFHSLHTPTCTHILITLWKGKIRQMSCWVWYN